MSLVMYILPRRWYLCALFDVFATVVSHVYNIIVVKVIAIVLQYNKTFDFIPYFLE